MGGGVAGIKDTTRPASTGAFTELRDVIPKLSHQGNGSFLLHLPHGSN